MLTKNHLFLLLPILSLVCFSVFRMYLFGVSTTAFCILIVAWFGIKTNRIFDGVFLALAFAFSIAGDWMLGHSGFSSRFIYGMGLFFIAHVWYIFYCLKNGRLDKLLFVIITACYLCYFFFALMPNISDPILQISVLLYLLVSCLSLSCAKGLSVGKISGIFFLLGIASLVFSDTLISVRRFLQNSYFYFLMYPTYYASQILITASFLSWKPVKDRTVEKC